MPLEKEDLKQIADSVQDMLGGMYSKIKAETSAEINGAMKSNVKPLEQGLSAIATQLGGLPDLFAQAEATKTQMSEIFAALQAPDGDPNTPVGPQAIDVEAITAKIKAEIEESSAKTYQTRIQALEQRVVESDANADKIKQQQIEGDRNNAVIASLKKVAPELNLFPGHEDVIFSKLAKDGVLQVSEDGTSWMAKTKRQDPYTKQVEDVVVPATPDILRSIIADSYAYYQQPRGGAGTNATPTQAHNPANRKITDNTTASDIQNVFRAGDIAAQEEIAAIILAQG